LKPVTRAERIAWVLGRYHPWTCFPAPSIASPHRRGPSEADRQSARTLKSELEHLSDSEFAGRYAAEQQDYARLQAAVAAAAEAKKFYHLPDATADFRHWSKASYWTVEEATALALGKDPSRVNSQVLTSYKGLGGLPSQFIRHLDLAKRAVWAGQLYDPMVPTIYLAWAKRMHIEVATELVDAIEELGLQIGDWKGLYEKAAEALTVQEAATKAAMETAKVLSNELVKARATMAQTLGTRERDSLLKLVIGMAKGGYAYDPAALRSDRVPEIVADLERLGIPLSADTVRKYLREAAEHLPPPEQHR